MRKHLVSPECAFTLLLRPGQSWKLGDWTEQTVGADAALLRTKGQQRKRILLATRKFFGSFFFLTLTHKRGRKCSTSSYRQLSLSFIHCNLMTWTSKGSSDSSCHKRQCLQEVEDIIKKKHTNSCWKVTIICTNHMKSHNVLNHT